MAKSSRIIENSSVSITKLFKIFLRKIQYAILVVKNMKSRKFQFRKLCANLLLTSRISTKLLLQLTTVHLKRLGNGLNILRMSNNYLHKTVLTEFIFSKRCMTEKAKLSIQLKSKLDSCDKLRELLFSEFGIACNQAELLYKRKMEESESLDAFFFFLS